MTKLVLFAFVVACATTEAVVPKGLRFAATSATVSAPDPATPTVDAEAEWEKTAIVGVSSKPLSTAMKCVMSLVFMYLIVTIIMKVISFKAQMSKLYSTMQADMKFLPDVPKMPDMPDMPKIPEGDKPDEAKEGDPEKAPLNPAEKAAADSKAAAMAAAAKTQAMAAGMTSWVTNMFSMEKLSTIQNSMGLVPMFCILVIFCRMRAKVDLQSEPQPFAKLWMIISTACLFVQILSSLLPQFPAPEGANMAEASFSKVWSYILMGMDIGATVGLYGGIGVLCYAVFSLKWKEVPWTPPAGGAPAAAPAVTPAAPAPAL